MTTIVTPSDYSNITKVFTTEESIEKYGRLFIMNKNEYIEYKKKLKTEEYQEKYQKQSNNNEVGI